MHLIVAALTEEVAGIVRGGRYDGPRPIGDALLYTSAAGTTPATAVLLTGSGRDAAGKAINQAMEDLQPKSVISTGFAGGTRDSLLTGNLVLATEVLQLEGAPFFWEPGQMNGPIVPDPALLARARSAVEMAGVDFHLGALVTLPAIAKTAGMKRWLGDRMGATAVDMESFTVALAAQKAGVPFLAVRAIVDTSDLDLPDIVAVVGQAPGGNRLVPVLRHIARRPGNLRRMIALGRAAARARGSIEAFMNYFAAELAQWDTSSPSSEEAA